MRILRWFLALTLAGILKAEDFTSQQVASKVQSDLTPKLSKGSFITFKEPPRWSTFKAPDPAIVVNVKSEFDVAATIMFCNLMKIPFLAQNGGNGWATTFTMNNNGVLINLAGLNQVTFSADKKQATIGAGALINTTIHAANNAGALVATGNCNCVGTLGAYLGGGYGNLMGLFGFGVDNIISMRVATADGKLQTVSASSNPELFWAMRGAGPNFGIVTSAVVKSKPATPNERSAWTGALIFTPDKLEQVVQAIQDLDLKPEMNVFLYFISSGPPSNDPVVLTTPFLYMGDATSGRAAFASLYEIGPIVDTTAVLPYDQWNTGGDGFCTRGPRKPSFGVGIQNMIPGDWRKVWDLYTAFQKKPGAEGSVVLLEAYSLTKARSISDSSASFPHRGVNFNAVAIAWYEDPAYDGEALAFGSAARDIWRNSDGLAENRTYINFANGDEDLLVVYGSSLARLRTIKKRVDPGNKFNQWFNIV
ncbi:FAD binding domain-containing protein [Lojkania enalia]|uniref:FAD binding domain-containing protein n=1 Tax=Lojkania enalia TaxID=147567 RepID=A0A9P4N0A1_9PLEO|nr:FAD binding domain-containing protein [Didymosphaeria enalia]